MKNTYRDIMERALSAYSPSQIADYIEQVRRDGLTEHGFPRLGANIGILMTHGRRLDLKDTFVQIIELCLYWIPKATEKYAWFGNNFSIRELCCCFAELEKTDLFPAGQLENWKDQLRQIDPWIRYDDVATEPTQRMSNWCAFGMVSEFVRAKYLGVDSDRFLDVQIACQLLDFDENSMYMEHNSPMCYENAGRAMFAALLAFGYDGRHKAAIAGHLDRSAMIAMQMQSVTGEMPFGGRSNQFLHDEAMMAALFEMEARRFAQKGDRETAGQLRSAAQLAAENMLRYLSAEPISHIKNRFPRERAFGCEGYAYFNKYMITAASNIYLAYLFCDETVEPAVAPTIQGGYALRTGDFYHKTFLNAGGYFLEFETEADNHYDANGLGRIHKAGMPGPLCLSVPFPGGEVCPYRRKDEPNFARVSLCSFVGDSISAEKPYEFLSCEADENRAAAAFRTHNGIVESWSVTAAGVSCRLTGEGEKGFMLPVFDFDGETHTAIEVAEDSLTVTYGENRCIYRFSGKLDPEYRTCGNRNGIYRIYKLYADELEVEIL